MQNGGQPIVIYAYNDQGDVAGGDLELVDASGNPLPAPEAAIEEADSVPELVGEPALLPAPLPAPPSPCGCGLPAPCGCAPPPPPPVVPEPLPSPPPVPCKTETETSETQEAGETIVHKPAHIIVNQPPTRLLIHHAPLIVKPSPLVVHQPGKLIKKTLTRNFLPRPVQVQPVYVRMVKPIEKKVLISKPAEKPGCSEKVEQQPLPETPCAYSAKLPPAPVPLPCPLAPLPPPPPPCASAPLPLAPVELDPTSEIELPAESVFAEAAYT